MNIKTFVIRLAGSSLAMLPLLAVGQTTISDTFTGASSSYPWTPFQGACLTAGDTTGTVPACKCPAGVTTACLTSPTGYYTLNATSQTLDGGYNGTMPDSAALSQGALRLTNGGGNNFAAGGLMSNFVFPSSNGLKVTFTTTTYHGDSGGIIGDGADGMSFYLLDASSSTYSPFDIGANGGSLGNTCSNQTGNYKTTTHPDGSIVGVDGVIGSYVSVGIDEYGNYSNPGDNTSTGPGVRPNTILVRGPGSVAWKALNALNSTYYPNSLPNGNTAGTRGEAVRRTCSSGFLWNYSNPLLPVPTATRVADYPYLSGVSLSTATSLIAAETVNARQNANPIQYTLTLTPAGLLSVQYSYNGGALNSVLTNTDITQGGAFPLPSRFAFGFSGSIGGSNNVHEVTCFKAALPESASSSAGLNEKQSAQVQVGTQVYFAFYNPNNWAGALSAKSLTVDSNNLVQVAPYANWDASCVLTGTAAGTNCLSTNTANVAAQSPASRTILTYNTATNRGVPFQWAGLAAAQTAALSSDCIQYTNNVCVAGQTVTSALTGQARLNYLRGDRTFEVATGSPFFRPRASVLGDIIDSSPTWVGPPQASYPAAWRDKINGSASLPENGGTTYPSFKNAVATRINVVYSGANDGLLHGFRAGNYTNPTTYNTASIYNDGREVLAYMPGNMIADGSSAIVVNAIHDSATAPNVDYSSANYGHNFFVDAPPATGDLFYGGTWHTWVMGGLAAGGQGIYALDVTDPTQFSEANAASLVIGEWTSATLTCSNVSNCGRNLGNTFGVPQIRRFHNGMWGAVIGNGFGSQNGTAGIYVMTVDPSTKAITYYYLQTGSSATSNGIAYTTAADLDGDHIVDYVYAGDLLGNVWRFDLTSANPANWAVSGNGPLFTTPAGQPITTQLVVAATPSSTSARRVVVSFGTGQQVPLTNTSAASYAPGAQSLYGIWDWNMNDWNSKGSTLYAALPGNSGNPYSAYAIGKSDLQAQTIASLGSQGGTNYRSVTSNAVCWRSSTTCSASNNKYGWYLDLSGTSEQIIYSPVLQLGAFIVNSTIPAVSSPTTCSSTNATGWTYAISPTTGGAFAKTFFGDSGGKFNNVNGAIVSGVQLNGTGSVSLVTVAGLATGTFLVTQTTNGVGASIAINPVGNAKATRLTWTEKR